MKESNTLVPKTELDSIYKSGKVSPDVRRIFRSSLDRDIYSTQGMNIEKFIESNRKIKLEMKEYLEDYKSQRSLMADVIYYLRNPGLAPVKFVDKVGSIFGKNPQLEAKKIAGDPKAIGILFEQIAYTIEQSKNKTFELEKQANTLYETSLKQRENIEKDITTILQNIAINSDLIIQLEGNYDKIKINMDKLLSHMKNNLGMKIDNGVPDIYKNIDINAVDNGNINNNVSATYEKRIDKLLEKGEKQDNGETDNAIETKPMENKSIDNKPENTTEVPTSHISTPLDKKKIEAIKIFHAINSQLAEVDNSLRDAKKEKLVLHQNYEKAKENLVLYERVLIHQVNEARNYFALLYAIYDAEVKYTIPTVRIIAYLATLQEITTQLAKQIFETRGIFNNLLDNVVQNALDIQENIINIAINPSWDPARIDQAETMSIELAKRTREFTTEMNNRLTEIVSVYQHNQLEFKEKPILDSGIKDDDLKKLLTES